MRRYRILIRTIVITAAAIPVVCGLLLSMQFYEIVSRVYPGCGGESANTPDSYTIENVDVSPYLMPDYEDIRLPSRDAPLEIAAFWIPADDQPADNAAVIITHGYSACRRSDASLLPAGMLHRAGFNVLVIDQRDVGESDIEDGRSAAGTEEYRDLLGAWDWLQTAQGIPRQRIGLFGYSLGGAITINAAGAEPGVQALWTDSAFARLDDVIEYALRNNRWLLPLRPFGIRFGQVISGDDLYSPSPIEQAGLLGDRPFTLVHGTPDQVVPYAQMELLVQAAADGGTMPEVWTTDSQHVASMVDYREEYERRMIAFFTGALTP